MTADERIAGIIRDAVSTYADRLGSLQEEFIAMDAARCLAVAIREHACGDDPDASATMTRIIFVIGRECCTLARDIVMMPPRDWYDDYLEGNI